MLNKNIAICLESWIVYSGIIKSPKNNNNIIKKQENPKKHLIRLPYFWALLDPIFGRSYNQRALWLYPFFGPKDRELAGTCRAFPEPARSLQDVSRCPPPPWCFHQVPPSPLRFRHWTRQRAGSTTNCHFSCLKLFRKTMAKGCHSLCFFFNSLSCS